MQESPRQYNVVINTGTILRFFLILIAIAALYFMSDVVLVVVAAIVIASAIEPVIRRLKRKGIHRVVSVIIIYVALAAVIAAGLVFFVPSVIKDAVSFVSGLPKTISLQDLWSPISDMGAGSTGTGIGERTLSVPDFVSGLQSLIVDTSAGVFHTASKVFGGVLSFVLIVVLSIYLAVKEDGVDDFLRIVAPVKHHAYVSDLWKRSQRKIALWLQGQVVLGLIIGVLAYIVLVIVGVPHALVFVVFAALLEIIPVFGPVISSVPPILYGFSEMGVGTGILLMILYLIIHQLENHLFYPLVVKKVVGVSPIIVILALIIGAKLAGVLGALIAVPLSAAFMEYINDIEKYKKAELAEKAVEAKNGHGVV